MRKFLKFMVAMVCVVSFLFNNFVFASSNDFENIDNKVIDTVLEKVFSEKLPGKGDDETITNEEFFELMSELIKVNDDNCYCLMAYYDYVDYIPWGISYEDFLLYGELSDEVQKIADISNFMYVIEGMYIPDEICTYDNAYEIVFSLVDNAGMSIGECWYSGYREKKLGHDYNNTYITFSELKDMMFYALFTPLFQRISEGLLCSHDNYDGLGDILYLIHGLKFKIGNAVVVPGGIKINDVVFKGDFDADLGKDVLCVYDDSSGENVLLTCVNISENMKNEIRDLRTIHNEKASGEVVSISILRADETEIKDKFENFEKYDLNGISGYEAWPVKNEIRLWQNNEGDTISRAQVTKTALKLWDDNFTSYDMKSEFTAFKDVSSETVYYHNYINALWQAGILKGDGNGYFYPDKPCTYGEVIKIFSCLTGWGFYAEELAKEKGVDPFPEMYVSVLNELDFYDFEHDLSDTNIKEMFPELVYIFNSIPTYRKTENGWEIAPSLKWRCWIGDF